MTGLNVREDKPDSEFYSPQRDVSLILPGLILAAVRSFDRTPPDPAVLALREILPCTDKDLAQAAIALHKAYEAGVLCPTPFVARANFKPEEALRETGFLDVPIMARIAVLSRLGTAVYLAAFVGRRSVSPVEGLPAGHLYSTIVGDMLERLGALAGTEPRDEWPKVIAADESMIVAYGAAQALVKRQAELIGLLRSRVQRLQQRVRRRESWRGYVQSAWLRLKRWGRSWWRRTRGKISQAQGITGDGGSRSDGVPDVRRVAGGAAPGGAAGDQADGHGRGARAGSAGRGGEARADP